MRAADQFHVGIVVDDLEPSLAALTELFGYSWCEVIGYPTPVRLPDGDTVVDLRFAYSRTVPRLEVIDSVPGTLWRPAAGSGIHHLGYWSDDVAADSRRLAHRGYATEAQGIQPDGAPYWAYHRTPGGPRIEIVSRTLESALTAYWDTGATG